MPGVPGRHALDIAVNTLTGDNVKGESYFNELDDILIDWFRTDGDFDLYAGGNITVNVLEASDDLVRLTAEDEIWGLQNANLLRARVTPGQPPKKSSWALWLILILLAAAGAGALYYFLVHKPG